MRSIRIDTLGAVKRYGYRLTISCGACRHSAVAPLDALIERYGADQRIVGWVPRARCTRCGASSVSMMLTPEVTPPFKP